MSTKNTKPKAVEQIFATAELLKLKGKRVRLGYQIAGEVKEVRGTVRMIFADSAIPYLTLSNEKTNQDITVIRARPTGVETL